MIRHRNGGTSVILSFEKSTRLCFLRGSLRILRYKKFDCDYSKIIKVKVIIEYSERAREESVL